MIIERQKILIVDDKRENLYALEKLLEVTDAEIISAQNGNDALIAVLNHAFSMALLDVQMPGMDGYELAELMRKEQKAAHLPIIFVSAVLTDEFHVFRGYDTGCVDYLTKPINPDVLLSKVSVFLELSRQRLELESHRHHLEELVAERTASLEREIKKRKKAAQEIRLLNEELEHRVRQRTAELETTNQELESFSYSVSHDLRAPLRSIDGFSQALLEDKGDQLDDEGKSYLCRICKSASHMSRLIDDMLQLSRMTRAPMNREQMDLSGLARGIFDELKNREPTRAVECLVQSGLHVKGDLVLLRAVMENLIGNAWKFTSKQAAARIELGAKEHQGAPLFYLRDNGAGFDMKYADQLFTPFQRLHSTEEYAGTGIGLATVRRILKRHGGQIWAEAEKGHGATFFFTLDEICDA
ncbi:MAG: response regulator [Myxococcota bacterium]|nr:response regulator [Myxococcota bacterium]